MYLPAEFERFSSRTSEYIGCYSKELEIELSLLKSDYGQNRNSIDASSKEDTHCNAEWLYLDISRNFNRVFIKSSAFEGRATTQSL